MFYMMDSKILFSSVIIAVLINCYVAFVNHLYLEIFKNSNFVVFENLLLLRKIIPRKIV